MQAAIVDTNVLLVANGSHGDVSRECRKACVERLLTLQRHGVAVIDDGYRILGEYGNKTSPNQPKGVGDAFLKWLLQNQGNPTRVHRVPITESRPGFFAEFPDAELQQSFDASDRKFVAIANAHPDKPPVWQAADCKWLDWWPALHAYGVRVEFLCGSDALAFHAAKFPGRKRPSLPE